ncbi:TlpA family protein disulfide reductase [Bacteroides congonensis]|uniref:TlpA family protein disulfide reductase n=1 Tax=Bacteroides congonensis TaxID=1871006 RepID=UPI003A860756
MKTKLLLITLLLVETITAYAQNIEKEYLSRNHANRKELNYTLPAPEYQKGKATLSGTISNYNPDDNLIFKIGAPNIVMGAADTLFPTVEADGSFTIDIPLYHSTQVRMIIGNADLVILLSPQKETNVTINLNNPPGKQFVFSGHYATINNEWCQPELITKIPPVYINGNLLDSIAGISANEFKKRCINQYKQYIAHNDAQLQFSEVTRTLANLSCAFDCLENLQATHYCLQTAYQKKENITREQAFAAFLDIHLPDDFHNYLKDFPVNHPLALYCYNYRNVITNFLYDTHYDPLSMEKYLLENAPLTKEEQTLIHQHEATFKAGVAFQRQSDLGTLVNKYAKERDDCNWSVFSEAKKRLNHILQDSTCLLIDYVRAIYMRSSLYNLKPLTHRQELMASEITNSIFLGIIQDMNHQMRPRQKTATKKFTVCEAPQVPEKELLNALIARHKGKVQFIDFWATWCGGCRQIIKEYEPLKKEIGEDQVAFIYLTGPSSIKKTWEILIQDIAGEHYWLNKEQWGYLWNHFQMTGLPMYLIIDKKGNIAKRFTHVTVKELKELLGLEINK